jgi:diguanylate cyclase (GGDEF)-like protein/PAS domain S-box-containing protein
MKIKINDYFDFEKANALLEGFTKSTGFVTAIQDLDGNILSKSGWRAICNDFHRKNCETASNCIFSDTELARQISKDEKYHFYKCLNGLIDVGLPIVIRGEHVANFFSGQFFFEEPDLSFFVKQAQKYGFDEKAYIEALKEVPVVSKEKAETVIHFLVNITQMIIEMTAEKLELTELNQELKNSRADFIANQELLDRNLKDLKESQRVAHESEERFQLLFNKAPLGYQSLDHEGRFIEVNQKWLDTLGYAREEVIGKWFGDFLCPEFVEAFRERFPVFKAQGHIHVEFEMLSKDGQRLFMSFEGKIGYSADGEFKQTHCILQDITDQRMAEEALRKSEERFRIAQEISPDGFTILHPVRSETGEIIDFAWVYENQAIANINQTDPQKVIGKRVLDFFPGHRGTIIFEAYKHVANTGETQILEEINAGEVISKPAWLRLVVVSMGEDIAILAQDITDRKAAEKTSEENVFRFQSLFNEMSAGAAIYKVLNDGQHGKDYIIQDFNRAALKAEGKEKAEVLGKSLYDLRPNIDEYGLIPVFQSVWKNGEPAYYPSKIYVDEKFSNWYENRVYKLPSGEIVAIFDDVTEKTIAEEAVKKQNDLFVSLLEILPVGVFMVDSAEGKPLVVNETGKALLGIGIVPNANEHNLSEAYKTFKGNTQKQYPTNEMPITLGMQGIKSHIDDMVVERPDGSRILLEVLGTPVNDTEGKPWASLVTFMDITDRKKAENELLYLSYHDHLTGLYNRRYFEQELKNLDTPENLPLSIIMFDVNGLKLVNDSFGHDLGDVLLKKSAEAIKKACREDDIAARIGGDEFVVLLPKTAASEALQISNYIKELASNEKVANMELSISYGYDTKKTDNQSIIEIIANAENHMYRHKLYERSSIRSKITDLIMNTLFEKSGREAAHSNRVSIICQSISSKLNMGKDAVNKMKIAGLIHDIGKIGVDERILNKPGSLTAEERGFIERHPEIGWRLLSSTDEFSELAKYVLSHHENWDGTGYPNGIKGEAIPLEARIISVADTYDAMTSERSYRKKMSREEAVKELKRCSGTQFDPMIVDVFLNEVLSEDSFR